MEREWGREGERSMIEGLHLGVFVSQETGYLPRLQFLWYKELSVVTGSIKVSTLLLNV